MCTRDSDGLSIISTTAATLLIPSASITGHLGKKPRMRCCIDQGVVCRRQISPNTRSRRGGGGGTLLDKSSRAKSITRWRDRITLLSMSAMQWDVVTY